LSEHQWGHDDGGPPGGSASPGPWTDWTGLDWTSPSQKIDWVKSIFTKIKMIKRFADDPWSSSAFPNAENIAFWFVFASCLPNSHLHHDTAPEHMPMYHLPTHSSSKPVALPFRREFDGRDPAR
jgi:hypothetical protein